MGHYLSEPCIPPISRHGSAWREFREYHEHPVSVLDTAPLHTLLAIYDSRMAVRAKAMECLQHLEEAFVNLTANPALGADFRKLLQDTEGHGIETIIRDALREQLQEIGALLPPATQLCGENAGRRDLVSNLVERIKARVLVAPSHSGKIR